jgi:hypothetical protein
MTFQTDYGGGGFGNFYGLWGGWFWKKIGAEGADFFAPQAQRAAKPPKICPPLGENFFFRKIFYSGEIL